MSPEKPFSRPSSCLRISWSTHLPPIQLFAIERVSKRFEGVVSGSHAIRHKQFLEVDNRKCNATHPWRLYICGYYPMVTTFWGTNPAKTALTAGSRLQNLEQNRPTPTKHFPNTPARLCPLLRVEQRSICGTDPPPGFPHCDWQCNVVECELLDGLTLPMAAQSVPPSVMATNSPSWREIYITDPPCRSGFVKITWQVPKSAGWAFVEMIRFQSIALEADVGVGITMGQLRVDTTMTMRGDLEAWEDGNTRHSKSPAKRHLDHLVQKYGRKPELVSIKLCVGGVAFPDHREWEAAGVGIAGPDLFKHWTRRERDKFMTAKSERDHHDVC